MGYTLAMSSGCSDDCAEDDSRNYRAVFSIDGPYFPSQTNLAFCDIPESLPAVIHTYPGYDIDANPEIFWCGEVRDLSSIGSNKWILQLKANTQCADGGRYDEWFMPEFPLGATCYHDDSGRQMPINSNNGGIEFFTMCPDPYRASNFGAADYNFSLFVRSPRFGSSGSGNCESCSGGYFVRFRADEEFLGVERTANTSCGGAGGLPMNQPMSAIVDCLM